ncbi:CYTH domain-containing protein [Microbacterium esteraromaticum]|uniref:CYTH domain-containing protein n=1 Tax=Microbacterium esteraromaticum TaxID=57043 RepID=UPI0019D3981D|nr:CYTH domain-containing protein [Microbacterium esteraromaticum]MBN7792130.1 CYTH domain-containing protein [Microbacterium esteraromaticum]
MTTDPQRTFEVERKYDADADTALPVWTDVPGVTSVSAGEARELDARYLDTADAVLARNGVALRRRTGGTDAGWHVKGPRQGDGRLELGWPLDEDGRIPEAVTEFVAQWTTDELTPLARIENSRTAYLLSGSDGVIAEFVDDRVRATDLRAEPHVRRAWREWEMELGPAAPADEHGRAVFFDAVERAVAAAGGRPPSSGSKLARALGL